MLKKLLKQHKVRWVGEIRDTMGQTLWFAVPVNFAMISATFFYTTLRHVMPWFDFPKFLIVFLLGAIIAFVIVYKFVTPSLYAYMGRKMFEEKKTIIEELGKINKRLDKLAEKD